MPFTPQRTQGYYGAGSVVEFTMAVAHSASANPDDRIMMQLTWSRDGVATAAGLGSRALATEGSARDCVFCATLSLGCSGSDLGANCAGAYFLARSGTLNITAAQPAPGTSFSASLTNARFEEWDWVNDGPLAGGRCLIVPSVTVSSVPVVATTVP